jgi:hypothetical protein
LFADEVARTMTLIGASGVDELGPQFLLSANGSANMPESPQPSAPARIA